MFYIKIQNYVPKANLLQRYFDFKQDLKLSPSRFKAKERDKYRERVLSLAQSNVGAIGPKYVIL